MISNLSSAEVERRLASFMRIARIVDVDPGSARARVTFGGETESAWLPFTTARAGGARVWSPPVVGEQVVVMAPDGNTAQAVIAGSLPSDQFPPPSSDGSTYQINLPGGVSISVAGGAVHITAPGGVIVNGDVVADGISLKTHRHGGVDRGGSQTDEPV